MRRRAGAGANTLWLLTLRLAPSPPTRSLCRPSHLRIGLPSESSGHGLPSTSTGTSSLHGAPCAMHEFSSALLCAAARARGV